MLSEQREIHPIPQTKHPREIKADSTVEDLKKELVCDFCGRPFFIANSALAGAERRKYCSRSCQSRACQGRIKARLATPPSKRYAARLKFSDPLYFN
ncbi:MAG: hypothetical protein JRN20_04930 [Nitrososphaerota archaeon]|jgi:hypothetical protein|nr:hypothetical protein [Nitrososphaerota archaeon]